MRAAKFVPEPSSTALKEKSAPPDGLLIVPVTLRTPERSSCAWT